MYIWYLNTIDEFNPFLFKIELYNFMKCVRQKVAIHHSECMRLIHEVIVFKDACRYRLHRQMRELGEYIGQLLDA
jgi:hypothetical protein